MLRQRGSTSVLRDVFSPATMRALAGVADAGRVLMAKMAKPAGGGNLTDTVGGKDVLVHMVDVLTGHPLLARLLVPSNILWGKPVEGDTMSVVEPANMKSPGAALALHGDGGEGSRVPPWFGTKVGIYTPDPVRVESTDGDVEVEASGSGKKVKLGAGATKGGARADDDTDVGTLVVAFAAVPGALAIAGTYTPGNVGGVPLVLPTVTITGLFIAGAGTWTIPLKGRISTSSAKVKVE